MTNFTQRSKLVDFFQTKFSNIIFKYITDVCTTFQKLFQRRNFIMVFVWMAQCTGRCIFKSKTGKHKGEIKTHQRRKNWKAKKSKQEKQKTNMHKRCIWKTSCNNPLGNWKKVGKSWMMEKQSYSCYLWVRVDLDLFISLLSI